MTVLAFIFVNFISRSYETIGLAPVLILLFLACSVVSEYYSTAVAFEFADPRSDRAFLASVFTITFPVFELLFLMTFSDKSNLSVRFGWLLIVLDLPVVLPVSYLGSVIAKQTPLFADNPCDVAVLPKRLPV
jgi:hypothetical protein